AVARVEPEEGRRVEEPARRAQEVLGGKQAVAAEEQRCLREEREEGGQEDGTQEAEEQTSDEDAAGSDGQGCRQRRRLPRARVTDRQPEPTSGSPWVRESSGASPPSAARPLKHTPQAADTRRRMGARGSRAVSIGNRGEVW